MTWPPAPETLRYLLLRFSQVFPFSCPIFGREPHACRFTVTVYPDRCHLLPDYPIRSCQHIRPESPYHFGFFNHRITLSARAKTFGGIVNPICLAAWRLMTESNLVGCSTGRSAGLLPLRILST